MTRIEILGTGPEIIRRGIRGIEPVMEEIIMQANTEIHVLAYMFTRSALPILNLIEKAASRGVKILMIINDLKSQSTIVTSKLEKIERDFPHVKIFDFKDPEKRQLHAKIIVSDRTKALVGSANFSWGGMYSNYEVGLLIEGEVAWKLADIIDYLSTKISQWNH